MTTDNYFVWRAETAKAFQALTEVVQLKALLQKQIVALGFDFFAFFVQQPVPFTRPRFFLFSTYPESWILHYERHNYYAVDPVLRLCQQPGKGIEWCAEIFTGAANLWPDAQAAGILSGFSCSAMASNRAIGILSIASRQPGRSRHRTVELEVQINFLADLSLRVLERLKDSSMVVLAKGFSERELEILKWTAEGKTSAEISLILAISEHTVNFHQKNMQKRFNVSNKTQIACYAAATGLI